MTKLPPSPPAFLPHEQLRNVVRSAPLAAIDLVIRNSRGEILLGLRNNEPAKGCYFVPGGMILKDERLADAFARILKTETNFTAAIDDARPLGVYEHFYANNRFGEAGYGTHYVVLGYDLKIDDTTALEPDDQHRELRWWSEAELLASPEVHDNAKAYFRGR
jgi:colanic acid biosynthesis protein WcaH